MVTHQTTWLVLLITIWLPACKPPSATVRYGGEVEVRSISRDLERISPRQRETALGCDEVCAHLLALSGKVESLASCKERCEEDSTLRRRECLLKASSWGEVERCAY